MDVDPVHCIVDRLKISNQKYDKVPSDRHKNEGLDKDINFYSNREDSVRYIIDAADNYGKVIIHGQAYSGKTSLAQLLCSWFVDQGDCDVYAVDLLHYDWNTENFYSYFEQHTDIKLDTLFNKQRKDFARPVYIVLDEAQALNPHKDDDDVAKMSKNRFWKSMKAIDERSNLKFILFSVLEMRRRSGFGGTPIEFDANINCSKLSTSEYVEIVEDFNNRNVCGLSIDWDISSTIWDITDGHCGFVSRILSLLNTPSKKPIQEQLFSNDFWVKLGDIRAIPKIIELEEPVDTLYRDLIVHGTLPLDKETRLLVLYGIAEEDDDYIKFGCNVYRDVCLDRYYKDDHRKSSADSLTDLVLIVLKELSLEDMRSTYSKGSDGYPLEVYYQNHFKKYFIKHTKEDIHVHSEVQYVNGARANGKVDFYINSECKWMLELLINGSRDKEYLHEHLTRENKKYKNIERNEYMVVDITFNNQSKYDFTKSLKKHAKAYIVIIENDFFDAADKSLKFKVYYCDEQGNYDVIYTSI